MSRPLLCLLYLNATITEGPSGIKFDGTSPRGLRIRQGISYNELVAQIHDVLQLNPNQRVCKLVYRFPIAVQAAQMNCVAFELRNDDDVEMMLDTHLAHGVLIGMEVNVEVESMQTVSSPSDRRPDTDSMPNPYVHFDTQYSGFGLYTQMLMNVGSSTSLPMSGLPSPVSTSSETPTMVVAHQPSSSAPHTGLYESGVGELTMSLDRLAVVSSPPATNNLYFSGLGTEDEEPVTGDGSDDGDDDHHFQFDVDDIGPSHCDMTVTENDDIGPSHLFMPQSTAFGRLDWDVVDASRPFEIIWPANWDPSQELDRGMLFRGKADVQMAVRLYSLRRHQECTVDESQPSHWTVRCKQHTGGCNWRLRAAKRKSDGLWEIRRYNGPHSCVHPTMSRDHHQLSSTVIANCIVGMVTADPSISVAAIIEEIRSRFQYQVSYKKAWHGKQKAIIKAYGDWDDSYRQLPKYMHALQRSNPGTVVVWDTVDMSGDGQCWEIFRRVFWAFKSCIDGFNHCRPVIQIDGTFLCGKYQGTLLIATSIDGNNRIYPIAFAIVEGENRSSWAWFLACIREYVTQRHDLCLISDRHAGIIDAVRNVPGWRPPNAYHRFCLRHVVSNFNRRFKNALLKTMVYKAGVQFQVRKFQHTMDAVRSIDRSAAEWFDSIPKECWTQCYDDGHRHGHMTTNLAECVNGLLKGIRRLPVQAIVHHTYLRLNNYFQRRHSDALSALQSGSRYSALLQEEMEKQTRKASSHRVIIFDRQQLIFQVTTMYDPMTQRGGNTHIVKLRDNLCSCGRFMAMKFPCSHVIAACAEVSLDSYRYVDDCYSIDAVVGCYHSSFFPIEHPDYWPDSDRPPLFPDQNLLRPKGRPRSKRIRNEMDWREAGSRQKCGICRGEGHNRKSCPQRNAGIGPSH